MIKQIFMKPDKILNYEIILSWNKKKNSAEAKTVA